jgi:DNA-binding beta-propeller fold protein YncE
MRRPLAWALVMVIAAALLGCGTEFKLPTEHRGTYSTDGSYLMAATWTGMNDIADILVTQGTGSQLFLLFNRPGVGTAPRGEVRAYALKAKPPTPAPLPGIEFHSLFVPVALCANSNRVFVLDEGDSCLARLNATTGRCDTVPPDDRYLVTDLSTIWRVREYGLLGGDTLSTFTDTSMAYVHGIAADDQGRVYVSGKAIVWVPDALNPSILTRSFLFRIFRYKRVAPGSVPPDQYMPGTNRWVRDHSYTVEDGSGTGYISDARGLHWAGSGVPGGPALFAADSGNGWVQKLSDVTSNSALLKIDADTSLALNGPLDVTADRQGFIYVADSGNQRILRFSPDGEFIQRVDVRPDADGQMLTMPLALAADDTLVYVADRQAGKVVRYRRQ